jgi:hypothetical protein
LRSQSRRSGTASSSRGARDEAASCALRARLRSRQRRRMRWLPALHAGRRAHAAWAGLCLRAAPGAV